MKNDCPPLDSNPKHSNYKSEVVTIAPQVMNVCPKHTCRYNFNLFYLSSTIVCSNGTVFPSNWLELSPSLEYNSRDLSISPMLNFAMLDIVFWGFHIIFLCVFIENTNNWMFPVNNHNPICKSVLGVYKIIPKLCKFTWQNWIKSMGCNPIWHTNKWCDVTMGKHYTYMYLIL